jgi:soluble lytic murein transglycosylase-like protein
LLIKRTYSIVVLSIALTVPAVAIAAPNRDVGQPRIGLADARPVLPLLEPGESLLAEMRKAAHRIQAARRARLRRERQEAFATLPGGVSQSTLDAIASCESGGNPTAVSADGSYRGKYQFDYGTWESVGGSGDPAAASEEEQDYRAALLYSQSGSSPWPICG